MSTLAGVAALGLFWHVWWKSAEHLGAGPAFVELHYWHSIQFNLILLVLYFSLHSILATHWFKRWLNLDVRAHRVFYLWATFFSTLALWALWSPLYEPWAWDIALPLSLLFYTVQLLGLIGSYWTSKHFDLNSFFGRSTSAKVVADTAELTTSGPYALCRHPTYFFTILLLCSPRMALGRSLLSVSVLLYIFIGSKLEERKLKKEFGESYEQYCKQTPWLVPTLRSFRRAFKTKSATDKI